MTASVLQGERSTTAETIAAPRMAPPLTAEARSQTITICHPVWRLERGGLERQLLQTIERLPREQFRHVLVVRGADERDRSFDALRGANVEVVRQASPQRDRLWFLRLASILRQHSVNVLHVRGLTMLVDAVMAAKWCSDIAVAFSFHGFEAVAPRSKPDGRPGTTAPRFGRLRRLAYRAAASRCDDRWAVSFTAAEAIAGELGMSPDAFGVLPNGVDAGRYVPATESAAIRTRLGLRPDRFVILTVGNLKPIKGHDVLLEAMRHLRGDLGRITLVLAGEDSLCGTLQDWANRNLPDADIRFVGRQDDPLSWYQAADLFVLPSRWEGMSNALLEAMSCGLPVIATAVGGNVDVIDHGRTGLLVQSDNAVELGMAMRWLMKDQPQREALADAARRHAAQHHSASRAAANYAERYLSLARRASAAIHPPWRKSCGPSRTGYAGSTADISFRPVMKADQ